MRWKPRTCLWALASCWPILTGAISCDSCDLSPQSSPQLSQMLSLHIVLTCFDNQEKPRKNDMQKQFRSFPHRTRHDVSKFRCVFSSPHFARTVRDRGFKKLKKWLQKTPDLGRTDHPWLLRILEDESLRALQHLQRMDTPFIPLSIFVTNSYKFPLHQLIQLAGLNT